MVELSVRRESWPIRGTFTISRGSKTAAEVVVVELAAGGARGRGECVPYPRYGETTDGVVAALEGLRREVESGLDRERLQEALAPGAARNALDCALWDLEAKRARRRAWQLAGLIEPRPLTTAYTLSLDTPARMAEAAARESARPLLKLKVTGSGDLERVAAVHRSAPRARLVVDANEAWTAAEFESFAPRLAALGVEMIEQPLPAAADEPLARLLRPIPVCADEACHDRRSLARLIGRYDMINIKLDKTGGLTEALALKREAEAAGLGIMVGCMISTSLAMAPAVLVAEGARVVDLDGPLLLEADRPEGLRYEGSLLYPPDARLWG
ncbi:MAG: N-acetyl-D-Glu racemase DgcA [Alphaproteobacteria bacterium]